MSARMQELKMACCAVAAFLIAQLYAFLVTLRASLLSSRSVTYAARANPSVDWTPGLMPLASAGGRPVRHGLLGWSPTRVTAAWGISAVAALVLVLTLVPDTGAQGIAELLKQPASLCKVRFVSSLGRF